MNILVSVIYVTYNCSDLVLDSIRSVEEQCKGITYELIIVDNASQIEEKRKLSDWLKVNPENRRVLFSDQNSGFGKGNNLGSKHANGKYLFFLNPDTIVLNDVITLFYNYLESSKENVVACGGNLLKPDQTPNDSYGNFPGLIQELCHVGLGLSILLNTYYKKQIAIGSPAPDKICRVPYIVGANIFIKAKYFHLLEGFDERFFLYYEETDLFYRLFKQGLEAHLLPEARIIHLEGSASKNRTKEFNYKKFEVLSASKLLYYRKWLPRYLMPFLQATLLMQILVQFFKGKMGSDLGRLMITYFNNLRVKAIDR